MIDPNKGLGGVAVLQEAVERIEKMEACLDALQNIARTNPETLRQDPLAGEMLHALIRYYEDGQWLRDYELDEQGLLPPGLKRGVLSQDGLHDFLAQLDLYGDPTGGKHIF